MSKRRSRKRKKPSVKSLDKRVKTLERGPEWKYVDTSASGVNCNTTGIVQYLSGVAQSAGASSVTTRIGNQVTLRKLCIRGVFHNDHGTPGDTIIRILIFKCKDVSNTIPLTTQPLTPANIFGMRSFEELYNCKVYWDHTFPMDTNLHTLIPFKYIKKMNIKQYFDNTGSAIGNCESNGLFIMVISDTAGTTDCPQLDFRHRIYFTDE